MASTSKFEIGEAFGYGWRGFTNNVGASLLAALALLIIPGTVALLRPSDSLGIVGGLAEFVVGAFIGLAVVKLALDIVDGRPIDVFEPFGRFEFLLAYLAATFLFGLAVGIGLVLLIVPGLIALTAFFFYGYGMVSDRGLGPIEALRHSVDITRGHRWQLFATGIVALLINVAGALAFGIGLLVSQPVTFIAAAYVFRRLRDEPVAEQAA